MYFVGEQVFRIEIADKNDHPPRFTQNVYEAEEIPEDANLNAIVTEVKALDSDTASSVSYSILDGNIYNSFLIESTTGKIKVNNKLDYENITDVSINYTSQMFKLNCIINSLLMMVLVVCIKSESI